MKHTLCVTISGNFFIVDVRRLYIQISNYIEWTFTHRSVNKTIFLSQLQKGLLHTKSYNPGTTKCFISVSCAIVGICVCLSSPPPSLRLDRQAPARRSVGITLYAECREAEQSVKEARKRFAAIIIFRKSNKNFNSATAGAESVAHLTECTEYNCRRRCLLSGVLSWK